MKIHTALAIALVLRTEVYGQAGARQAMDESTAKQKEAVRKQADYTGSQKSWFTLPWIKPEPIKPITDTPLAAPTVDNALLDACKPIDSGTVESMVAKTATKEGVPADLLKAVVKQESMGNPCAVSTKGAMGLMQLMPATATELGVSNPFDPAENLTAGARMLAQLLQKYSGDVSLALGAYNAGPKTVDTFGGLPPYPETQTYVEKIMDKLPPPAF